MIEETLLKKINESNRESQLYRLFFLKNDEERSVEVVDAEEIDFITILYRLENGESVFISPKCSRKKEQISVKRTPTEKNPSPWYFTRL